MASIPSSTDQLHQGQSVSQKYVPDMALASAAFVAECLHLRRCMRRAGIAVPILVFLGFGVLTAQTSPRWRWTGGAGFGVFAGSGVIGRQPSATGGHEDLVARLDAGLGVALQAGL